jgi:hypothetical protein
MIAIMRLPLVGALLAVTSACPPPQQVASDDGLFGYWRPRDGEQLVFAFAPPSEAEELFNLSGNMVAPQTKPVGAVYQLDQLVQLTTFEATERALNQTVLVDMGSPPGTQFSTRIDGFERGVSMQLESKKLDGGSRPWDFYDFCPRSKNQGWGSVAVTACPTSLANGGSAAFDKQGRLYVYTASGLAPGTTCPPGPGFLEVQRGCGTAQFEAPNGRLSAMRVHDDDVLRLAYLSLDNSLRVRERKIGDRDFTETTLATLVSPRSMQLLDQRGEPLLLSGDQVYRRTNGAWVAAELKKKSTGQPMTALGPAAVDVANRLWVAIGAELWVERESDFAMTPAPGPVHSLYLDPTGDPHVLMVTSSGLEYAVLHENAWRRRVIDSNTTGIIVTHGTTPWRVLTTSFSPAPPWLQPTLITIHDDGRLEGEVAGGPFNFMAGINTTFAAVGPRGEVAASLTGEVVMTRSPKGRLYATPKKLELSVDGPSVRVRSADGRFSCDQRCTFDVTLGERIAFEVEKKPGVVVIGGPCDGRSSSAPCWATMIPPPSASTAEVNTYKYQVKTRATPLKDAFVASNSQGLATTLGVSGDWVAVGTLFTGTAMQYQLDDVVLPVTGSFESVGLVMVNRVTKQSLFVALPKGVSIERVLPDGSGGLFAVLSTTNQPVQVGGVTVGASQTNVLAFVHVTPAGTVDRNVTLVSSPRNMPVGVSGVSLGVDGSAAAVASGNGPLTGLGVPESNALVRVAPDGTRTVHGFAGPFANSGAGFSVDTGRIAFAVNTNAGASLYQWSGGQLQSLALPGATVQSLHATATTTVLMATSTADLSIAGRSLTGRRHVLSVDSSNAVTATFSLPTATSAVWSQSVAIVPDGVAFMSDGELRWLSPALAPLRAVLPLPTTTMRVSGVQALPTSVSNGSVFILAPPNLDFGEVTGSIAVAQLALF